MSHPTIPAIPTNWPARLAHVPTWALEAVLAQRGTIAERDATVHLPGLAIDPVASSLVWRGREHIVTGRTMEVLYALAQEHACGRHRVLLRHLAKVVWGNTDRSNLETARTYVSDIRKRFPGLINEPRPEDIGTYRLMLDG